MERRRLSTETEQSLSRKIFDNARDSEDAAVITGNRTTETTAPQTQLTVTDPVKHAVTKSLEGMSVSLKRGRGQPTLYREEYCDTIIELAKNGASVTEIAVSLGVTRKTVYEWCKVHTEFSEAMERAIELAQVWWERYGTEAMISKAPKDFNSTVWQKMMSARFSDYRETTRSEISGPGGKPIPIASATANLTSEEAARRYKEIMG